jgi:cyclopropane fatty-acyl-phospholipid synthase-like methyltransferase
LLGTRRVYAVDYHQELLDELRSNFRPRHLVFVKNNGDDFPGVPPASIDFIFSFGTFVHLDQDTIARYLVNMRGLLAPGGHVVIQYSDKSKPIARRSKAFSQNDPDTMRRLVASHGYEIQEEDTNTMWHSAVIRFGLGTRGA